MKKTFNQIKKKKEKKRNQNSKIWEFFLFLFLLLLAREEFLLIFNNKFSTYAARFTYLFLNI
jgi:hypothetical protein